MKYYTLDLIPNTWVNKYKEYRIDFLCNEQGFLSSIAWEAQKPQINIKSLIQNLLHTTPDIKVKSKQFKGSDESYHTLFNHKNHHEGIEIIEKNGFLKKVSLRAKNLHQKPELIAVLITMANKFNSRILFADLHTSVVPNIELIKKSISDLTVKDHKVSGRHHEIELIPSDWFRNNILAAAQQFYAGDEFNVSDSWRDFNLESSLESLIHDLVRETPYEKTLHIQEWFTSPKKIQVSAGPQSFNISINGKQENNKIKSINAVMYSNAPMKFLKCKVIELANNLNCVLYLSDSDLFVKPNLDDLNKGMVSPKISRFKRKITDLNSRNNHRLQFVENV